jgi:hypothetical protein
MTKGRLAMNTLTTGPSVVTKTKPHPVARKLLRERSQSRFCIPNLAKVVLFIAQSIRSNGNRNARLVNIEEEKI